MPPLRKGPDRLAPEDDDCDDPDSDGGEAVEVCRSTDDHEKDNLEDADGRTNQPQAQSHADLFRVRANLHLMSMSGSIVKARVRSSPDCPVSDRLSNAALRTLAPQRSWRVAFSLWPTIRSRTQSSSAPSKLSRGFRDKASFPHAGQRRGPVKFSLSWLRSVLSPRCLCRSSSPSPPRR